MTGKMMKNVVKKLAREEKGQAFILVLVFLLAGGLILATLLGYMGSGLKAGQMYEQRMDALYAADAGIEDALWKLMNDPPASLPDSYQLTDVNGMSVNVLIEEITTLYGIEVGSGGVHEDWFDLTSELKEDEGAFGLPDVNDEFTITDDVGGDSGTITVTAGSISVATTGGATYDTGTGAWTTPSAGDAVEVAAAENDTAADWTSTTATPTATAAITFDTDGDATVVYTWRLKLTNEDNSNVFMYSITISYDNELSYLSGLDDEDVAGLDGTFESFDLEFTPLSNVTLLKWEFTTPRPRINGAPDPGGDPPIYTTVTCTFKLVGPAGAPGITAFLVTARSDVGTVWEFEPLKITAQADDGGTVLITIEAGVLSGGGTAFVGNWQIE